MSSVLSTEWTPEEILTEAVTVPVDAYLSESYVRAERDKLWRKVWQQVGRVEEIPEVGSYITYRILDDSIVVVRTATDKLKAYYNVCPHRGRMLLDTPKGAKNACGHIKQFACPFHGWGFKLTGENNFVPEKRDWDGALTDENTHLSEVKVDTWGGWVWINMDPASKSLQDFLHPAVAALDPFELQNMRCRWRRWIVFDCNWKVAMEAFAEIYHVNVTHPEFMQFGDFQGWAKAQGKHSNIGYDAPKGMDQNQAAKLRIGTTKDPRIATAEMQLYTWEQVNTNTTRTLVDAAIRLKDELPEGTPGSEVLRHWLASARATDAARGVIWPTVDSAHVGRSGTAWQIFPNFQIGHAVNNMLCYSARPYGYNPDQCIFEAAVYELYPAGEEPKTQWEYLDEDDPKWGTVLPQDFSNMAAVQQGMKSQGFRGTKPNPYRERSIANLHHNLAQYMEAGKPRPLKA